MHQPTRLLVHWHMFTNQQKLCTKLIHCHVCKSYRVIKISKNPKKDKKKTNYVHLLEIFCENFWPESMSRDTYIPLQNLLVSLNLALSYHHEEKKVKHDEKKKHRGSTVSVYYLVTGFLYMFFNCCIFLYKVYKNVGFQFDLRQHTGTKSIFFFILFFEHISLWMMSAQPSFDADWCRSKINVI